LHNEFKLIIFNSNYVSQENDEKEAAKKRRYEEKLIAKANKKRRQRYEELFRSSGIGKEVITK
jgi:methylase of polypeptide subunit release factors